jgi:ubiquinone/menaquinone biosynthesis C-methylase UbiE
MEASTAIRLISKGISKSTEPQQWCDLGAGNGLFTRALSSLLPINSSILAVDKNETSLKSIQFNTIDVSLSIRADNFTSIELGENYDGILMANALHYVSDQHNFLKELKTKLKLSGRLLIVEYERRQANQWVPYPIAFGKLKELGEKSGFSSVEKLEESPSMYDHATIYSALLIR